MPDAKTGGTPFQLDTIEWVDEAKVSKGPLAPETVKAVQAGVRRKLLSRGDGGFFSHYAEFPADYTLAPHSHDRDEMLIVVKGDATILGTELKLGPFDSIVLNAGVEYGLHTGSEGLGFFAIRAGDSQITFAE